MQGAKTWEVEKCASKSESSVRLLDKDRTAVVATVPRASCEALMRVERKIEAVASYHATQLYIASPDAPNAFATLDKNQQPVIVVTLGMLQALHGDEDAWAGLLGHEIAHHVQNHSAGREDAKASAQATGQTMGNVIARLIPGVGGFIAGNAANLTAANAMYGSFTRPQEAEADELGLKWMVAAGYDPQGMERLFRVLATNTSGLPGFLSTHPGAEDRARKVREFIKARQ